MHLVTARLGRLRLIRLITTDRKCISYFASLPRNSILCRCRSESELFGKDLTLPERRILDNSKPKEFVDDNFKFDENDSKFSKRVENTVGKGEIARLRAISLFPHCVCKKTCTADT